MVCIFEQYQNLVTANFANTRKDSKSAINKLTDDFTQFKDYQIPQIATQLYLLEEWFNALTGRVDQTEGKPEKSEESEESEEPKDVKVFI